MRKAAAWPLVAAMLAMLAVLMPMLTTGMDVPVMVGDQQFTLRLPDDADQATLEQGIAEMSAAFQKVRVRVCLFESSTTDPPASDFVWPPFAGWKRIIRCTLRVREGIARLGHKLDWEGGWVESVAVMPHSKPKRWKLHVRTPCATDVVGSPPNAHSKMHPGALGRLH